MFVCCYILMTSYHEEGRRKGKYFLSRDCINRYLSVMTKLLTVETRYSHLYYTVQGSDVCRHAQTDEAVTSCTLTARF